MNRLLFGDNLQWLRDTKRFSSVFIPHPSSFIPFLPCPNLQVVELMRALHSFLKNSPMMAYLAMMASRLVELHRVLKPTGSLYLHCNPTASHRLKDLRLAPT